MHPQYYIVFGAHRVSVNSVCAPQRLSGMHGHVKVCGSCTQSIAVLDISAHGYLVVKEHCTYFECM